MCRCVDSNTLCDKQATDQLWLKIEGPASLTEATYARPSSCLSGVKAFQLKLAKFAALMSKFHLINSVTFEVQCVHFCHQVDRFHIAITRFCWPARIRLNNSCSFLFVGQLWPFIEKAIPDSWIVPTRLPYQYGGTGWPPTVNSLIWISTTISVGMTLEWLLFDCEYTLLIYL